MFLFATPKRGFPSEAEGGSQQVEDGGRVIPELPPGEPVYRPSEGVYSILLGAVGLERLAVHVIPLAVELDEDSVIGIREIGASYDLRPGVDPVLRHRAR